MTQYNVYFLCYRYKQKLSAGLEREKALEQRQVQVQLDWQRRCEDTKAEHYLASEQLIQTLTQARDQVTLSYVTPEFDQSKRFECCLSLFVGPG